ncbi:MAG: MerR family transcriptional regulator [Clostridium sp.]|nr:MerR family transcriptional regulator [Prevotella sp.]MCM1428830.1 MerR family transcriptional regulator [Clostridium sp.]MCM1475205.1 MerR family transcriptional regulator [Muribaculaceae bacterium]
MSNLKELPIEKKYFKIQEVAEIIGVTQSTLRFWEKEFPQLEPIRSGTNIRYYTANDIELLRIIYYLVKTRGLKIEAAKLQIASNRKNVSRRIQIINNLKEVRDDLQHVLKSLEKIRE